MANLKLSPIDHPEKMSSYWKRQWKVIAAVFFFGILFNGCMSFGPILQGKLIDTIVSQTQFREVLLQAGLFVAVIVFIQIMRFFKRYYVRLFANRTSATMRMMIYNNIMNKDIIELSQERTGDLMTKAISDVDICVEGMRKVTTEVFDTGVLMLSYLISMLVYDWKITIAACIFVPVAMCLAEYLKKVIVRYSKAARSQSSHVADLTYDNIEHTVLLRVNGLEGKNRQEYFHELDELETKSVKASILENSMQPIYNVIALLGIVVVLFYGGKNVIAKVWTVGMFSTYITIFAALTTKASKAAKLFNSFQKATVSWQRIKPYLTDYQQKSTYDRGSNGDGMLIVKDFSFHYPEEEELVVQNISFSAKPGDLVGITGPVACGKSSLGVALQGLYSYLGSIKLDGVELREYSEKEISRRVSYLGHLPQLLSDTIYNNITLGEGGDISDVLHDVCFDEDLKSMPEGIHTMVGSSGVRLSGGQQARIGLARALYRHSPLIILDDPFSAVDMKTEEAIIENLRRHYSDCIILLISHRLSVFPRTDSAIVIHSDRKAEYGTHKTLLSSSELYASIYRLQMEGGNDHEA
ncbi:ABC transporter ATP-binding protein [Proteiniborus sp.]|uniref:ABC transporter ATP-binding protein n=1 Tax=Proteiniborus sp. TaxID=2079015 RepID=UPI00332DF219